MLSREVWTNQRRLPKIFCYLKRRNLQIGPPGNFITLSVQLLMMIPAQRHRKLVTDFAPERSGLREFEVVGITGRALANETRLRRDEGEMGLVPSPGFPAYRQDAVTRCRWLLSRRPRCHV